MRPAGDARLAIIAFPIAYYAARYARRLDQGAVLSRGDDAAGRADLVKVYAWKLILAEEGI